MNSDWLRSAIWPTLFPFVGVCRPDADPTSAEHWRREHTDRLAHEEWSWPYGRSFGMLWCNNAMEKGAC